jgi:beta-lactamase class A/beta-lactamase class A VEB
MLLSLSGSGQNLEVLRQKIVGELKGKHATVGVSIHGEGTQDTLSINGDVHLPMQSVFKFHLALVVMHQIDQGKFSLEDDLTITKDLIDTYKHLYSPIVKEYPNGTKLTVGEVLEYTVALSDNLGCDLLFEKVGGTQVVQDFLHERGIKDIAIKYPEIIMQADWQKQYENWTTAKAATQTLKLFYENANNLLSEASYQVLLNILKETKTGQKSIRGFLPENTIVAHKTGYSGINEHGVIGAFNNIGIVFLPNGKHFYISVFVSDSKEDFETTQAIIAKVAKLAWDHYSKY